MEQLKKFEKHLWEEEKSALTVEKYLRDTGAFLHWCSGREISKSLVIGYKNRLLERYAPASVNSMLAAVNRYLGFLGREDCRARAVKLQREVFDREERELTEAEYRRLLRAAEREEDLYLLMQTICATGIRVSEHRFITVEAAKKGEATVSCKGKIRTVLLPRKLCRMLAEYAKRCGIRSGSIFLTKGGKPLDRSRIWARMQRLCVRAGVCRKKVFPHNLRHLFARVYYSMERDIVRLADILGHSSVNTTRIYTRESGAVHRRQIEKMPLLMIT